MKKSVTGKIKSGANLAHALSPLEHWTWAVYEVWGFLPGKARLRPREISHQAPQKGDGIRHTVVKAFNSLSAVKGTVTSENLLPPIGFKCSAGVESLRAISKPLNDPRILLTSRITWMSQD